MKEKQIKIEKHTVTIHKHNTVIVGAGAAGMNCAKKLYEFFDSNGIKNPASRIAIVTRGLNLGASRMSGSDKQTYYKMGTSPETADSAESFVRSLTAAGCCHGDLALAEAIGSLRGFYNLVEAGVPFPHNSLGTYIGYKTDNDPYERATSAGPKTSRFMSESLEKIVRRYGIEIFDHQEVIEFLKSGERITGVAAINPAPSKYSFCNGVNLLNKQRRCGINRKSMTKEDFSINIFYCENLVLAAGGPGELYKTSVYPSGQFGIHGLAFRAGLAGENLTESQFGLASTKFRWNVSGSYMQAIPRIFSIDADGKEREFLADFFPTMSKMATNIFLKGYQWPFDPEKITNYQSSLIDLLVFNENQKGRRVFMDFTKNPIGNSKMSPFKIEEIEPEALNYLKAAGAMKSLPIERLAHINTPAIEIYKEHGIDLYSEPLEISVCAQHNNGGFGVNYWWESNIKHTFVTGEMAGTHGVKRPGGAALNAGQVGSQRAAEFIANAYGAEIPEIQFDNSQIKKVIERIEKLSRYESKLKPDEVILEIQNRMTTNGGHIRSKENVEKALSDAVGLYRSIEKNGFKTESAEDIITAAQAEHLALCSAAYLRAILELLNQGSGSRGSHLVLSETSGIEIHPVRNNLEDRDRKKTANGCQKQSVSNGIHPDIIDPETKKPLRFKPENKELRKTIIKIQFNPDAESLFDCVNIAVREAPKDRKTFEPAWKDFREAKIYF